MKIAGIAIGALVFAVLAFATIKKVSPLGWGLWGDVNTEDGVALKGYDPVAYFEQGAAVIGSGRHTATWQDAVWHFSSAENRDLFQADPERYAPQFGSFCAFAVSKGFTADPTPEAWHIEDGKLYVFADENVRDDWVTTIDEGSLEVSHEHWAQRE